MDVTIRDASADDAGTLTQLLERLGYPATPARVLPRLERLARDAASRVFVADDGGEIIGLAATHVTPLLERDRPVCRITAIVVRDDARRRGVGAALVARVESEARRHGCDRIELTSADHREDAHTFYERLGFASTARRFVKTLPDEHLER